jgi:hypothetical protein
MSSSDDPDKNRRTTRATNQGQRSDAPHWRYSDAKEVEKQEAQRQKYREDQICKEEQKLRNKQRGERNEDSRQSHQFRRSQNYYKLTADLTRTPGGDTSAEQQDSEDWEYVRPKLNISQLRRSFNINNVSRMAETDAERDARMAEEARLALKQKTAEEKRVADAKQAKEARDAKDKEKKDQEAAKVKAATDYDITTRKASEDYESDDETISEAAYKKCRDTMRARVAEAETQAAAAYRDYPPVRETWRTAQQAMDDLVVMAKAVGQTLLADMGAYDDFLARYKTEAAFFDIKEVVVRTKLKYLKSKDKKDAARTEDAAITATAVADATAATTAAKKASQKPADHTLTTEKDVPPVILKEFWKQ